MQQIRILCVLAASLVLGLASVQAAPSLTPPQTLGASGTLSGFGGAAGAHEFFRQPLSTWKGDIGGITSGVNYSFVVTDIDASSVVGPDGRYLYFNLQDAESGSSFKHLGINVYLEPFSGAAGGTLFQCYQNWTSEGISSHGLNAGELTMSDFDLRFDFTKASSGSGWLVMPFYRLAAGSWTAFSGGSFTGSVAFDFLGAKLAVGFDGGADGSLTFGNAYLASPTDTCWVDDDWSALADDTPVVFPGDTNKHTIGVDAYGTCQAGVDNVTGSSVLLAPGTYEEQVEIDSDLELMGSGMGVTTILAPVTMPLFFTTAPNNNYPVVYVHDAASVVMHDFTVDGAGRGNTNYRFIGIGYRNAGGSVADCEIKEIRNNPINGGQHGVGIYAYANNGTARTLEVSGCDIYGFQKNAMALIGANLTATVDGNTATGAGAVSFIAQNGIQLSGGAQGSITGNTVTGFAYTPATYASAGLLVWSAAGSVLASGNTVGESQVGIWYIDAGGDISLNEVNYTALGMGATPYWWGIVADPGVSTLRQPPCQLFDQDLTLARSTENLAGAAAITTTVYRNEVNGGGNGTGIEADALGTETLNFTATENSVTACARGFDLYREPTATLNAVVNTNGIAGNTFGLLNSSGVLQDGMANWWGSASGPQVTSNASGTGDSVAADVDYSPWLGRDDAAPATPGYQHGLPMHWWVNTSHASTIQEAVVRSATADSVTAKPGSYYEHIVVVHRLYIEGETAGTSVVYPATSNVGPAGPPSFGSSQIVVVQSDDVTLRNLVFDGDNPLLTPPGTLDARNGIITNYNTGDWDRLIVTGCTIRNIYLRGLYASAATATNGHVFRDNTVDNVNGLSLQSAGIMLFAATGEVVGNAVSNSSLGIFFQAGSKGVADSNQVSSCELGIGANNNDAATTIRYNSLTQCGNEGGIQLVMPLIATDVGFNTLVACTSGVVIYGGNLGFTQNIHDNRITGSGPLVGQGVYASTDVSPWGFYPVSADLKRNVIQNHRYGVVLNEHIANQAQMMDVTIGGALADTDSLFNDGLLELLLEDCNDNIDARFNYWGVTDCDSIEARIYHQPDLASLGLVDWGDADCWTCPIETDGDFNFDGVITSADVIYLVNYVFKGGPAPLPIPEAGDVTCDGSVTSSDIIFMINWVFKGGPQACDICSIL